MAQENNDKNHYSAKPPIFNREKFDYWKDRIEIFFIGCDADLWDIVLDGYTHYVYDNDTKFERRKMCDQQKKDHTNHHTSITILLNAISFDEYEKITNIDSTKFIFDSLKMTYEGNEQFKETKSLALIQKCESFKMEADEIIK